MKKNELKYFKTIRDYFEIFLPNQKGASYHTIKNYKICMNQFLDFAKDYLGIKLRDFDFNDTTIELVESFLEFGENKYHWSAQTRNLKLAEYSIMAEPVIPGSRTTLIPVARAIYSIV